MKKYIISLSIIALVLASCTKEVVTETKTTVPYKGPTLGVYGTWKVVESNNNNIEEYFIINKDNNFVVNLTNRDEGFKRDYTSVYDADEKTFNWDGWLLNYMIVGDTMTWMTSPTVVEYKMVKDNSSGVTEDNWTKKLNLASAGVMRPEGMNVYNYGFGVRGDFLYISGYRLGYYIYEMNGLNGQLIDSLSFVTRAAIAYRPSNNNLYYARASGTDNMKKSVGIGGVATDLSTNALNSVRSISLNPSSGTVYAFNSNRILYAGTEGGNFTELSDLSTLQTYLNSLVYYKNDEFLTIRNSTIYRVKIAPSFSVVQSYRRDATFSIDNIGTDGSTIWVYGYNQFTGENEYRKVTLD